MERTHKHIRLNAVTVCARQAGFAHAPSQKAGNKVSDRSFEHRHGCKQVVGKNIMFIQMSARLHCAFTLGFDFAKCFGILGNTRAHPDTHFFGLPLSLVHFLFRFLSHFHFHRVLIVFLPVSLFLSLFSLSLSLSPSSFFLPIRLCHPC